MTSGLRSSTKVGFILSQFPCYDETFVTREMAAMARAGLPMVIFSIKDCRDQVVHQEAKALMSFRRYRALFCCVEVWLAFGIMLFSRPRRFLIAFLELWRHCWRSADFLFKGILLIPQACAYARLAEQEGVTRLHGQWATHPATQALFIHRLTGIPWSFTGHAHDIHVNTTGLAYKAQQADFLLTCTKANRRYLQGLVGEAVFIHVVYHGLDLRERFVPPKKEAVTPPFHIVTVGSLLPCKGLDRLLHACAGLSKEKVSWTLTIVGGGPLESTLRAMASELGIADQVSFTGYVTQEEMPRFYRDAHCFVLASVPEIHWGIPNVVVEALACERAVVTTQLPALREVIPSEDEGILVDRPDPEVLTRHLARLAGDPEGARAMGRCGRKVVTGLFDLEKNGQRMVDIFCGKPS